MCQEFLLSSERVDSTVWVYLCCLGSQAAGGYSGALGRSRVNSSLTPIHYGPLLPPSRSAALRHSQAPAFTHNVNLSGQALRHRGGAEPASFLVRNTTCVFVFFLIASVGAQAQPRALGVII